MLDLISREDALAVVRYCKDPISNIEALPGVRWIPVTEQLPEQYSSVVGWTMYGEMGEVEHDGSHFLWAYDNDFAAVTHWMPFPEPPADMRKGENG